MRSSQSGQPGQSDEPTTVVVVDDHPAIVAAVTQYLAGEPRVSVVGSASDGDAALRLIDEVAPQVAIVDVRMPKLGGIELAHALARRDAETAVVLYTGFPDRALLIDALEAGARGFVLKEAPLDDLTRAILTAAGGGVYVDPTLASVIAGPQAAGRLGSLSPREREVLKLLADGMHYEDIAKRLFLSPHTVRSHVKNAMDKLEADTRTQAVASALRQSIIT